MSIYAAIAQATNIVLLIGSSNADIRKFIVWRTDTTNPQEVLSNLEIDDVSYEDNAKIFEHPIETGEVITDHIIFDPNSVSIQAYISLDDTSTLEELEYLYQNTIPLQIRANNKVLSNAIISSKPFKISANHFDKTLYNISFKQIQEVTPVYVTMKNASNASNTSRVNSGVKQAKTTTKNQSWFYNIINGNK